MKYVILALLLLATVAHAQPTQMCKKKDGEIIIVSTGSCPSGTWPALAP